MGTNMQDSMQVREPRALAVANELVDVVGLKGRGRIEIEADESGRVRGLWTHEHTPADELGRFDATDERSDAS